MMTQTWVSNYLWQEFTSLVNMTPEELGQWLQAMSASEDGDDAPEHVGVEVGWRIHDILATPRDELTEEDAAVMGSVVGRIRLERRHGLHPSGSDKAWRERLMSLGHDPLKSSEDAGASAPQL